MLKEASDATDAGLEMTFFNLSLFMAMFIGASPWCYNIVLDFVFRVCCIKLYILFFHKFRLELYLFISYKNLCNPNLTLF